MIMITLNDFLHKNIFKNQATSNIKISTNHFFFVIELCRDLLGDGIFELFLGIVNLHPSKGTKEDFE